MYPLASEIAAASTQAASATLWLSVSSGAYSPHAVKAIALIMPKTKRNNKRFAPAFAVWLAGPIYHRTQNDS